MGGWWHPKSLEGQPAVVCPRCDGFKTVAEGLQTVTCPECGGTGAILETPATVPPAAA